MDTNPAQLTKAQLKAALPRLENGLVQVGCKSMGQDGNARYVNFEKLAVCPERRCGFVSVDMNRLPEGVMTNKLLADATLEHLSAVVGFPVVASKRSLLGRGGVTFCILFDGWPKGKKAQRYAVPTQINYHISFPHRFADYPLAVPLGLDASGEKPSVDSHVWMPLPKLLHVMLVGMTGGGKSNYLHDVAGSLFAFNSPHALQACLIDGANGAAFSVWRDVPHLMTPLAVNLSEAVERLGHVKDELERREALFSATGFNLDIDKYNRIPGVDPLPHIWLAIDECGTLADEAKATGNHAFTDLLGMIAKRARKTGVYIWLGAQNPTADVIPTGIKGQVTNIAFRIKLAPTARMIGIVDAVNLTIPGRCLTDYWGQPREMQAYYMTDEMLTLLHKLALKWGRAAALVQPRPGDWMTADDVKVCVGAMHCFARQLDTGEWVYPFPINKIINKDICIGNQSEGGVAQSWLKKRAKNDLAPQGFLDITNDDGTPGYVMTPKLLAALEDALTRPEMRAIADKIMQKQPM
jgi:hypothetical protein